MTLLRALPANRLLSYGNFAVTEEVLKSYSWDYRDRQSIEGGWTERVAFSNGQAIILISSEVPEAQANVLAREWQRELIEIEVSDDFAASIGLGPDLEPAAPAGSG